MISSLYLMPTLSCNCVCDYCYIPDERKKDIKHDSFFSSVTERFIRQYQASLASGLPQDTPQLRFIGGEPYLKFDLLLCTSEIVVNAFHNALIVVNTNGTLINEHTMKQLLPLKDTMVHIISLDGLAKVHNSRRHLHNKENAFERALEGIRLLQSYDFRVYINMVLDEESFAGFEEFILFCMQELRLDSISVSLRQDFSGHAFFSLQDKFSLLRNVYAIAEQYQLRLGGHHRLLLGKRIPGLKCKAGTKSILVTPFGSLSACQRFVGRITEKLLDSETINFAELEPDSVIETFCYTDENVRLGEKLYEMYTHEYSHYLAVHELDRILFGVL